MDDIVKRIINGELTRDNDEKYAGGLWDFAGEVIYDTNNHCDEELQEVIYSALWKMADEIKDSILLTYHKTDGGAEYLHDKNLQDASIVIRLDGGSELIRCNYKEGK